MAAGPQDAPRHAGQVVRRVLLRRNIAIDAETAQNPADQVMGRAVPAAAGSRSRSPGMARMVAAEHRHLQRAFARFVRPGRRQPGAAEPRDVKLMIFASFSRPAPNGLPAVSPPAPNTSGTRLVVALETATDDQGAS